MDREMGILLVIIAGFGMLIAIVYISLNVLADVLVVLLVPKLRTAQ